MVVKKKTTAAAVRRKRLRARRQASAGTSAAGAAGAPATKKAKRVSSCSSSCSSTATVLSMFNQTIEARTDYAKHHVRLPYSTNVNLGQKYRFIKDLSHSSGAITFIAEDKRNTSNVLIKFFPSVVMQRSAGMMRDTLTEIVLMCILSCDKRSNKVIPKLLEIGDTLASPTGFPPEWVHGGLLKNRTLQIIQRRARGAVVNEQTLTQGMFAVIEFMDKFEPLDDYGDIMEYGLKEAFFLMADLFWGAYCIGLALGDLDYSYGDFHAGNMMIRKNALETYRQWPGSSAKYKTDPQIRVIDYLSIKFVSPSLSFASKSRLENQKHHDIIMDDFVSPNIPEVMSHLDTWSIVSILKFVGIETSELRDFGERLVRGGSHNSTIMFIKVIGLVLFYALYSTSGEETAALFWQTFMDADPKNDTLLGYHNKISAQLKQLE